MNPDFQTVAALVVVAVAATLLVLRAVRKRQSPGCGGGCPAVSREVKDLQAKLKRR